MSGKMPFLWGLAMLSGLLCAAEPPGVILQYSAIGDAPVRHPALKQGVDRNAGRLKSRVADVMALSESEMLSLVPTQSGVWFAGCPVKECLNPQGSGFAWDIHDPGHLRCLTCGGVFPNGRYRATGSETVVPPSGRRTVYPYYEEAGGRRVYIQAAIDYRKRQYFEARCRDLANLYYLTGEEAYGRRAALILLKFARHYDDLAYKYEYPFQAVVFHQGTPRPEQLVPHGRVTRWTWWYYIDIPHLALQAYDLLMTHPEFVQKVASEQGVDFQKAVLDGFLLKAVKETLVNREPYSNMSPIHWLRLAQFACVTGKSDFVHIVLQRIRHYMKRSYLPGGAWCEAAVGYHHQSYAGIRVLAETLRGFSDPEGADSIYSTGHLKDFDPAWILQLLAECTGRFEQLHTPDNVLTMNDTAPGRPSRKLFTQPSYLLPYPGLAMLAAGAADNPVQWYTEFTSKYGHDHNDLLNAVLYANRADCLSDLGYTHTHLRPYTTGTAVHNLVVADGRNQERVREGGNVEYAELGNPFCKIIAAEAAKAYPWLREYRRCSFLIPLEDGRAYVADFFTACGERERLDYFFHGNPWQEDQVEIRQGGRPLPSAAADLMPARLRQAWRTITKEADWKTFARPYHIYGYFTGIRRHAHAADGSAVVASFRQGGEVRLRLHFPVEPSLRWEVFTGVGPSLHRRIAYKAKQGTNRAFVCVSSQAPHARPAVFKCVADPSADTVEAVEAPAENALLVRTAGRTDLVFVRQKGAAVCNILGRKAEFRGDYGMLSLDAQGKVLHAYVVHGSIAVDGKGVVACGPAVRVRIDGADGARSLALASAPRLQGDCGFVRVCIPSQRTAKGNLLSGLDGRTATLQEKTGLVRADGRWQWDSYPGTAIPGDLYLEFCQKAATE